jgi:hypothetical protein
VGRREEHDFLAAKRRRWHSSKTIRPRSPNASGCIRGKKIEAGEVSMPC